MIRTRINAIERLHLLVINAAAMLCLIGVTTNGLAATIDTPADFSIPREDLAMTLNSIAIQANLQIFFEQKTVAGLTAPPLSGTMSARDALRLALADSGLVFVENADETILVRPQRRAGAAKSQRQLAAAAPAGVVAQPAMITIPGTEGTWLFRARGLYLDPRDRSDAIDESASTGLVVPSNGVTSDNQWYPEVDLEHFWTPHWSTEISVTAPEYQDLDLTVAGGTRARVGAFKQGLNDVTMKYDFLPDAVVRPYVGVGINVTAFSHVSAGPFGLNSTAVGPVGQVGFDIKLGAGWFFNADAKWARVRADLHFDGEPAGLIRLDPVLYGIGFGYRFGGTPAHSVPAPVVPTPVTSAPVLDSDGDGVPDDLDRCPGTPAGVKVDAAGCPLDSDHDGVPDYLDRCPGTPVGLKVDAVGCEVQELVLRGVTFETGSAKLTAQSTETLDSVVAVLRQRPNAKAEVHGYTDSIGSDAMNLRLSERRAQAVVAYFEQAGIAPDTIMSRGFGKANPVASNSTAEGRAQNRRVTVEFMSPVSR
jgi:OOP family OmpA-OmpF porin